MRKRLRKKKHIGEFAEWGVQLVVIRSRKDGFDDFFDAFVEEAVESNGCICGGGGKEDILDVVVELGSLSDDVDGKMMKVIEWLNAREDVLSWRGGLKFDVWHSGCPQCHTRSGSTKGRGLLAATEPLEYNLEDLLRQCDPEKMKLSKDDEAWVNSPPVGNEVL